MSQWNLYLYSVLVCCVTCAIVMQLVSDARAKSLVRILCAMLVAVTVAKPLVRIDWKDFLVFSQQWNGADIYIREGEETARDARAACIQKATQTYILEKAKALGAEILEVTVTLNEDLLPAFAEIHGRMDQAVQEMLMTDLGIPKEQQSWIWNQESSSSDS